MTAPATATTDALTTTKTVGLNVAVKTAAIGLIGTGVAHLETGFSWADILITVLGIAGLVAYELMP